jgi:hypothetical protein
MRTKLKSKVYGEREEEEKFKRQDSFEEMMR